MTESLDSRDGGRPMWVLRESPAERFPYRLTIEQGRERLLALRVRDRWPGPGMQVCNHSWAPHYYYMRMPSRALIGGAQKKRGGLRNLLVREEARE